MPASMPMRQGGTFTNRAAIRVLEEFAVDARGAP
jgi:hypothetical protein